MQINRKELVQRHNIIFDNVAYQTPLSLGNGQFCFTCDITGFQGISHKEEENPIPLCTMAQWFFHTTPVDDTTESYSQDDVQLTRYHTQNRTVHYAVEEKKGNEKIYTWLRENPHKGNLAKITLCYNKEEIHESDISAIHQEMDLYNGMLSSTYEIQHQKCEVSSWVSAESDTLNFTMKSSLMCEKKLSIKLTLGYPSPQLQAVDYQKTEHCNLALRTQTEHCLCFERGIDTASYFITIQSDKLLVLLDQTANIIEFLPQNKAQVSIHFSPTKKSRTLPKREETQQWWNDFWLSGAAVQFIHSKDSRAKELERRVILSQYLQVINCTGTIPPAETGLFCNSWYGKFHLEMYPFHVASLALFRKSKYFIQGLSWYKRILPQAMENAKKNGYKGARWPKMVGPEGIDSPSKIATLLVWQQPHIIYLVALVYRDLQQNSFLEEYWTVIKETTDFMADYLVYNDQSDCYELTAPLIPVQETYDPHEVLNPTFELQYFKEAFAIAIQLGTIIGKEIPSSWALVSHKIATPLISQDLYMATAHHIDTFQNYHHDHPSMLMSYGLLKGKNLDVEVMKNTLSTVLKTWDYSSLWGWDFAILAMCATRLNVPEIAVDALLFQTDKNTYSKNGQNFQQGRTDLPAYLPGNGALLWAIAFMVAGFDGCKIETPGFPQNGNWNIEYENFLKMI